MANQNGTTKAKKTVLAFTAGLIPAEGEKADAHCSLSGIVQAVDGKPTNYTAHIVVRDHGEKGPSWWPGISIPLKRKISYGPDYGEDEMYGTDLHQVPITKGSVITLTASLMEGVPLNG